LIRNDVHSEHARELARLSAVEMVAALGLGDTPELVRQGVALSLRVASWRLGATLAELDASLDDRGLPLAAANALARCGVGLQVSGAHIAEGPCLILANHPGAYDALTLMWALARRDLLILAADRHFLRALPRLSTAHLNLVGAGPEQRAGALKRSLSWLRRGGAVLHFPAGAIEPDADFAPDSSGWLGPWQPGVPMLIEACARVSGRVLVAGVRGVHSPRAKRLLLTRWAERRGVTTLSPLLQLVRGLHDVRVRVCLLEAEGAGVLRNLEGAAQIERLRVTLRDAIARV
jgi:hypothetical protein